jgi:DNA-directed RNA polymerase specialized sigma24 family protein
MAAPSAHTTQLHDWLERMRAGDLAARDELLRGLGARLERLARKMLRRFPGVQRWVETEDVLQNALLRLLRALEQVQPGSMREFFGLAAEQMRRELLDLARHFHGPLGHGANHASHFPENGVSDAPEQSADRTNDTDELERWGCVS